MSRPRRRRIPTRRANSRGNIIASIVVMSALLVVLVTAQRGISTGLSQFFVGVTDTPEGSGVAPEEQTVRLGFDSPELTRQVARLAVARAVSEAREAAERTPEVTE